MPLGYIFIRKTHNQDLFFITYKFYLLNKEIINYIEISHIRKNPVLAEEREQKKEEKLSFEVNSRIVYSHIIYCDHEINLCLFILNSFQKIFSVIVIDNDNYK